MKDRFQKCLKIIIWGILSELIIFICYKEFTYFNYASIPPTYVSPEVIQNEINVETPEITVAEGNYILEFSYKCTADTEWQLINSNDVILCQGVLDPEETKLHESFEISSSITNNEDVERAESVRFNLIYAKEGELLIESFSLNRGTEKILTLQGKDFNSSYLGFRDSEIKEYYYYVGRQEFYGLHPYQQITIQNNTSDILYFDLNDCVDYENPQSIITEKKLEAGESWQYYSNEPISYQVALYSATAQLNDISVSVDNKEYMNAYKTAVAVMMTIIIIMTFIIIISVLADIYKAYKKYWKIAAVAFHILGIFFYIIKIEPYIVNIFLLVPVFMIVAALLLEEYDKKVEYCQEYNIIYAGIFTILLCVGMYIIILNSKEGSFLAYLGTIHGRGLLLYVLFVITTILMFFGGSYIAARHNAVFRKINPYLNSKEALLLGIMSGNFIFKDHVGFMLFLDWRRWQLFLVLAMLAAVTICFSGMKYDKKSNDWALKALYLFEIISMQINRTIINIYGADSHPFGETHHISAYYDEITYIAKGEPFRGGGSELYGHYAIFWRLPMMIFGNNLKVIGIVAGVVAAITFLFFILSIHRLFRLNFIKIMASLTLWSALTSSRLIDFSIVLHRYVFLSIVLYLMVRWQKVDLSIKRRLIGYLICILALVWNTESGLCISLAWAVYIVIREIENKDRCFLLALKKFFIQIVIVCIEVVLFFASVELYNRILCVDKVSESELSKQNRIYGLETAALNKLIQRDVDDAEPDSSGEEEEQEGTLQNGFGGFIVENTGALFDSNYMNNNMKDVYHFENQPPFSAMVFILLISLFFLSGTGIIGKSNHREYNAIGLAVCVFGLGILSHEVSRGYQSLGKGGVPFLLIFFMLFEKVIYYVKTHPKKYTLKNNIVYLMGFFMLIGFIQMELYCFVAVRNFDMILNEKNILDYNSMQRDMEQFAYYVPEDTYAYGNGVAEVYMSIDREIPDSSNTQYIVTDAWRDVDDQPYVKVRDIPIGRYIYTLYYNQGYVK